MVENPNEADRLSPYEAGPGVRSRRAEGYQLPPVGPSRSFDRKHFRFQDRIGVLMLLLLVGVPVAYVIAIELGWV